MRLEKVEGVWGRTGARSCTRVSMREGFKSRLPSGNVKTIHIFTGDSKREEKQNKSKRGAADGGRRFNDTGPPPPCSQLHSRWKTATLTHIPVQLSTHSVTTFKSRKGNILAPSLHPLVGVFRRHNSKTSQTLQTLSSSVNAAVKPAKPAAQLLNNMVYSLVLSLYYIYIYICTLLTFMFSTFENPLTFPFKFRELTFVGGSASNSPPPAPAAEWYSPRGGKAPSRFPRPSQSSLMLKGGFCPAPSVTTFKTKTVRMSMFHRSDGTERREER